MIDLSEMSEEDVTRWPEDGDPESSMGERAAQDFEGGDDVRPV